MESADKISKKLTQKSKTSFYYSFLVLPEEKRKAIYSLYAFCRYLDDIVDESEENDKKKLEKLNDIKIEIKNCYEGKAETPVMISISESIKRFGLSKKHLDELVDGVEMDIKFTRYVDFQDLRKYCYKVASTVGLLCMEIFGFKEEKYNEYAENLALAFQLTNIIRDVKIDGKKGRIYIPLEEIRQFNYSEKGLLEGSYTGSFVSLMEFQAKRAEEYYKKAANILSKDERRLLLSAEIMMNTYYEILKRIKSKKYDVFNNEIKLSKIKKIAIMLKCLLGYTGKYD